MIFDYTFLHSTQLHCILLHCTALHCLILTHHTTAIRHVPGKVQALYDAAMIWLNGRHTSFKDDVTLLTSLKEESSVEYRERAIERATSALTLGG